MYTPIAVRYSHLQQCRPIHLRLLTQTDLEFALAPQRIAGSFAK
jgi:hypothetical protein